MAQRRTGPLKGLDSRAFLFSPASSYPRPTAYVVDDFGTTLHSWTHTAGQPDPGDDPPSYLRGWNHVEADQLGNLFAIVPLHALLKLSPTSELEWLCNVSAHHDLALSARGDILVLTEAPRRTVVGGSLWVLLDNRVTVIDACGVVTAEHSLYDVLRTDDALREIVDAAVARRRRSFLRRGWPDPNEAVPLPVLEETREILRTGAVEGEARRGLRRLRDLPGSPCDALHTNTLELVDEHPDGLWDQGDVLLCMRELNLLVVVDLDEGRVRWWWGADELSGPHQPSMLPSGRVLVFDNGVAKGRTRILQVDPRRREIVWSWAASPPESFFCPLAGGCELLPNGNFLVANSTAGAAFELTPDGSVVWRLTLPVNVFGRERGRVSIYRFSGVGSVQARGPALSARA